VRFFESRAFIGCHLVLTSFLGYWGKEKVVDSNPEAIIRRLTKCMRRSGFIQSEMHGCT
jgi:hypothetical protein